jgi:hypothetical protein
VTAGTFCDRRVARVQAMRTQRRWFAGLRKEYARRAFSLAIRFKLSDLAFVTPASTAQTSSLSHRAMVQARVSSSGMSSYCDFVGCLQRVVDGPVPCGVVNHAVIIPAAC